MIHLKFPSRYYHDHPPVRNANDLIMEKMTVGQRVADVVASAMGSWRFIIIQSLVLTFWVVLNITAYLRHWDPYPFILLNLFLSLQAAYTAPIIMMSQNRSSEKDRIEAHNDYEVNRKSEEEIRVIMDHLFAQNDILSEILKRLPEAVNKEALCQENGRVDG